MKIIRIAEKLRELRERDHLMQREVADYLGVRQQSYADYEMDVGRPNIANLKKLAILYHVSVEELLGISEW